MRPDSLVKMTLGGLSLTLLQTASPSSGSPDLTTHFFAEFDAAKDGPFGSRDFYHLRPRFQRACPCSHVRYTTTLVRDSQGIPRAHDPTPEACLLAHRLTGTAVQLSWELRTGGHSRRTSSTEVHFGQLEVLECLWPRAASEPEYTEVKAEEGPGVPVGVRASLTLFACVSFTDPELPQLLWLRSLSSALRPSAPHTNLSPGAQGKPECRLP